MAGKLLERLLGRIGRTFKRCSMCQVTWRSRERFLSDPDVTVAGYIPNFDHLELGIFLFDHKACGTTLSIGADRFLDLYDGPVFQESLTATAECPGYCLNVKEFRPCPARCECACVREILQIVNGWRKHSNPLTLQEA